MKKSIVPLILFASAALAQGPRAGSFGAPAGGRGMGMVGGPRAFVTGVPYSAVQVVQRVAVLPDGNSITRKSQTNVFRDSQGRVRTEETVTPPTGSGKESYTLVTILDYAGGYRYLLDSSTMTAYQSPLRKPPASAGSAVPMARTSGPRRNADNPQVVRTVLAPQSVNGVLANGTQHIETIPAGQIGNEKPIQISRVTWISNDLKVPVQIKSRDPRFGTTDMELTNIVPAEPSGALFVVPAGYSVKAGGRGFGGFAPGSAPRGPRSAAQ